MPSGSVLDVGYVPVIAAVSLGGPAAAAWVGLLGTTQARELRREVPWYGSWESLRHHVAGDFECLCPPDCPRPLGSPGRFGSDSWRRREFLLFSLNVFITATFVSLRDSQPVANQLRVAGGAYLVMLALAPVAWLMAQTYATTGWWAAVLFAVPVLTNRTAYRAFVEVREMFTETVASLAEAVDKRDKFTGGHSQGVQKIAMDIGRAMKVSDEELEALEWGGLLHDIGKIGVPDAVLLKQERLTREERTKMNMHPVLGAEIIAPVKHLGPGAADHPSPPRVVQRIRLSRSTGGRRDPQARPNPPRRRRVRGHDAAAAVPHDAAHARAGAGRAAQVRRDPVRSGRRGCLRPDEVGARAGRPGARRGPRRAADRRCGRLDREPGGRPGPFPAQPR